MILQSLNELYQRLSADPENGLPVPGFSLQNITFCIVIRPDGTLVDIQDVRKEVVEQTKSGKEKKTLRPLKLLVPGQSKPPGQGLNPCFLWDNTTYLLGYKKDDPNPDRTETAHKAFVNYHLSLNNYINHQDFRSICLFLQKWKPANIIEFKNIDEFSTGFGVFQIIGNTRYVHDIGEIKNFWLSKQSSSTDNPIGHCLISGTTKTLASLHEPSIKGVNGAQSSGAKLVSFNLNSFTSLQKEQGYNAPVSEDAAFAYCNALNYLLSQRERTFRLGDATTLFWTDKPSGIEELLPFLLANPVNAEDITLKQRISLVLNKIYHGRMSEDIGDTNTRYYILGLSPNASRLSIRFFHTGTLGELFGNLNQHFSQLRIIRQWDETNSKNPEPLYPTAWSIIRETSRDSDGIPPLLAGGLMRSILLGHSYPEALALAILRRSRVVEKNQHSDGSKDNINYFRASFLKAWLLRNHHQIITEMLDESSNNNGYRLGRLFALLEKTQQDALPGINATIRERFYSSASATPRAVFGRLLRTYPHHLAKLEGGQKFYKEKLAQDILSEVKDFPAHLSLQDQAQFALGYYHQRKAFFTPKPE